MPDLSMFIVPVLVSKMIEGKREVMAGMIRPMSVLAPASPLV